LFYPLITAGLAIQPKPAVGSLTTEKMLAQGFARLLLLPGGERRRVGSAIGAARPIPYIIARVAGWRSTIGAGSLPWGGAVIAGSNR
jgi:hypothetical protein